MLVKPEHTSILIGGTYDMQLVKWDLSKTKNQLMLAVATEQSYFTNTEHNKIVYQTYYLTTVVVVRGYYEHTYSVYVHSDYILPCNLDDLLGNILYHNVIPTGKRRSRNVYPSAI